MHAPTDAPTHAPVLAHMHMQANAHRYTCIQSKAHARTARGHAGTGRHMQAQRRAGNEARRIP
eukprot:12042947-Alexandrium_andersonii.AAC.1